jgi:hypothetical protein
MLFTFNKFWKSIILVILTWICYGIWGYEFCVVTLLAVLISTQFDKTTTLL